VKTVDVNLFRDAVAFTMTLRKWGNRRSGDMAKVEMDASKSRFKLSKQLVESPELDAINQHQGEVYKWCLERSVPSFFKDGLYLVRLSEVENFEAKLKEETAKMQALIKDFCDAYPKRKDEARAALNGQYREDDYPTVEDMPGRFSITWNWIAFGVPENLPAELRASEAAKIEQQFKDAETEIMSALREGFGKIVKHVTDRLGEETKDGEKKPKIFRDTLFEDMTTFVTTFSARNLVNDTELEKCVKAAQSILANVSGGDAKSKAQVIRDSSQLRAQTAEAFTLLKSAVDKTIADKPQRKFNFDDE